MVSVNGIVALARDIFASELSVAVKKDKTSYVLLYIHMRLKYPTQTY